MKKETSIHAQMLIPHEHNQNDILNRNSYIK